jgi:small conductance mechanosensitive channel
MLPPQLPRVGPKPAQPVREPTSRAATPSTGPARGGDGTAVARGRVEAEPEGTMDAHIESLTQIRRSAIDLAMTFGPRVLVAGLILVAGYFAGRWAGRGLMRALARLELEPPVRQLIVRLTRLLVLAVFAMLALQNLGVELLPLLAGMGVVGAGLALATQGVLSNLVAGLTIIFTKPYRVGEYVSLLDEEGEVQTITMFSTVLGHPDRSRVVIPNRKIVGEIMHNYGKIRQLDILVGVSYQTDLDQALATVGEVLRRMPRVLPDPAPVIQVTALADSAIDIAIKPWVGVPDVVNAAGDIKKAVVEAFRQRSIVIPAPQREIKIVPTGAPARLAHGLAIQAPPA